MNDPSCSSASDNSEAPQDNVVNPRPRNIEITALKHVNIDGQRKLLVRAHVTTPSNTTGCERRVPVKIQIKRAGEWVTKKSGLTNRRARYRVYLRDLETGYRAVATRFQASVPGQPNQTDDCFKAVDIRRHRHLQ